MEKLAHNLTRANNLPLESFWDVDRDGTPNVPGDVALDLNDLSGTQTSAIILKQFATGDVKTSGQVQLTATGIDDTGTTVFTATATYWIGTIRTWGDTPITTNATWDTFNNNGVGAGLHDYLAGTITDGSTFSFAKGLWAIENNYINSNSVAITFDLKLDDGLQLSTNSDTTEVKDFNFQDAYFYTVNDMIPIPGRANTWFIAGGRTEQLYNNESSFYIRDDVSIPNKRWTNRSIIQDSTGGNGYKAVVKTWLNPNTGNLELWIPLAGREIGRYEITSWTNDGFPNIIEHGSIRITQTSVLAGALVFAFTGSITNGFPDIVVTTSNSTLMRFGSNTAGNSTTPDYTFACWGCGAPSDAWRNVDITSVESVGTTMYILGSNRLDLANAVAGLGWSLRRYTYTGSGSVRANWTRTDIVHGLPLGSTIVPEGTGDVVSVENLKHLYIDTNHMVNSEPTIYVGGFTRDPYIYKITKNTNTDVNGSSWDVIRVIGNGTSVAGVQTNGTTGLTSTCYKPIPLHVEGDFLYFTDWQITNTNNAISIRRADITNNYAVDNWTPLKQTAGPSLTEPFEGFRY